MSHDASGVVESEFATKFRVPFYLALNACSSIGIVFSNKVVFQVYNFKYGTLLTFIHFIFTFVGLEICRQCGMFELKRIDLKKILPLCVSFCGFVALTNLSLVYNSVGFYQLMKVLTTPIIVVIQTLFYNETFPTNIKLSLALTCVGVAIATVTDSEANLIGTLVAISALLVTCMYQIWVGTKQKELECNSYQLLYWQAPISAVILVPIIPLLDDLSTLSEWPNSDAVTAIIISSLLAFLVNISIFLVIGKTSPVTYNVLGHFKLTIILTLGFVVFNAHVDYRNIAGVLVTLSGVFWYTHIKTQPAASKK
ncbi:transmembrane protein, putative [Bodo saltans]|uniref:Transmembrane protein, putative n=1 Tax=Bodo saltans TaxID=75058 RepID=A0A0S4IKX4_BODSA|nr:transmembrane protein, putative [Bodo saltans]|eukprot:CUF15972.1 transmembrane protein, putative [Bodo saltans]